MDLGYRNDFTFHLAGAGAETKLGHIAQARGFAPTGLAHQVADIEGRAACAAGESGLLVHALAPLALDAFQRIGSVNCVAHFPRVILARTTVLVDAQHISRRIAKFRGDLGRIRPDGLHDLASVLDDQLYGGCCVVHHDVDHQPGRGLRRAAKHPDAAHFAHSIIKRRVTVVVLADLPAEDTFIEVSRYGDVRSRNFDVANLAVSKCGRHLERLSLESDGFASLEVALKVVKAGGRTDLVEALADFE